MDLLIRVRDNDMVGVYLIQADGLVVITTPKANEWLYEHAKKNQFMCARCQALTRTSELDDTGVCKEGCRLETPHFQKILDTPIAEVREVEIGAAAHEMVKNFITLIVEESHHDYPDDSLYPGASF